MTILREPWPFDTLQGVSSAWVGLEDFIIPLIRELNIKTDKALEFGVDHGYSSWIFSKIFKSVTGVDSFEGDIHIVHKQGDEFFKTVKERFIGTNVNLVRSRFEDFISSNNEQYDLIHIDIVHLYEPTYKCAEWALDHSNVVILHDTCSFPEINSVCLDLSKNKSVQYYNIPDHHGLGVLYRL